MKTPHKHAELIKAWADGAQIQYKSQLSAERGWVDDPHPSFDVDYEWRIKPEPKPDFKAAYKVPKTNEDWCSPQFERMQFCKYGNLLLTFDGETGALKAAEVLS